MVLPSAYHLPSSHHLTICITFSTLIMYDNFSLRFLDCFESYPNRLLFLTQLFIFLFSASVICWIILPLLLLLHSLFLFSYSPEIFFHVALSSLLVSLICLCCASPFHFLHMFLIPQVYLLCFYTHSVFPQFTYIITLVLSVTSSNFLSSSVYFCLYLSSPIVHSS